MQRSFHLNRTTEITINMAKLSNAFFFLSLSYLTILRYGNADEEVHMSSIKELQDKLFKDYDKNSAPATPQGHNSTNVIFDVVPRRVIDLDEEKSQFILDALFIIDWVDSRLKWNATEYGGLKFLQVAGNTIWLPDFRVYNGDVVNLERMKDEPVLLESDGTVVWDTPDTVTSFCDVTTYLGSYPNDNPVCNVTVELRYRNGTQLELTFQPEKWRWNHFSNSNAHWEVIIEKSLMSKSLVNFILFGEALTTVDATFSLKRRPPAHLDVIWTPTELTMVLTLAMFWIPSNSGKKITLGITLLVILAILTAYCAAVIRSPQAPLFAGSFVQSTAIVVSSAVALEILIVGTGRICCPRRPPQFLVQLLSGSMGDYMCMRTWWKQSTESTKDPLCVNNETEREWLMVTTFFDKCLFIVYIAVFAAIHC